MPRQILAGPYFIAIYFNIPGKLKNSLWEGQAKKRTYKYKQTVKYYKIAIMLGRKSTL